MPTRSTSILINHLQNLIRIEGFGAAKLVFIPESNLGFEASWLAHEIRRSNLGNVCIMEEDQNRAGIKMNRDIKKHMCAMFQEKANLEDIKFHKDFICIGDNNSPGNMKTEIINQLLNYSRILEYSKNKRVAPKETYGGKRGYGFDDHAIALQINLLMKNVFLTKDKYKVWRD